MTKQEKIQEAFCGNTERRILELEEENARFVLLHNHSMTLQQKKTNVLIEMRALLEAEKSTNAQLEATIQKLTSNVSKILMEVGAIAGRSCKKTDKINDLQLENQTLRGLLNSGTPSSVPAYTIRAYGTPDTQLVSKSGVLEVQDAMPHNTADYTHR